MLYFFGKRWKNRRRVGGSAPKPLLTSGGWGIRPQNLELLSLSPVTVAVISKFATLMCVLSKTNKRRFTTKIGTPILLLNLRVTGTSEHCSDFSAS